MWLSISLRVGTLDCCKMKYFVILPCVLFRAGCNLDYWISLDFYFLKWASELRFWRKKSLIQQHKVNLRTNNER